MVSVVIICFIQVPISYVIIQGCELNGERENFLLVELESIAVFKTEESCAEYVPQIFKYLRDETILKEGEISTKFRDLEAFRVGSNSKTMAQILRGE